MVEYSKNRGLVISSPQITKQLASDADTSPRIVLLHRSDLMSLGIDKSDTTLLRWELVDRFPRRVKMAGTSVAWIKSEIDKWLQDTAEDRKNHHYTDPD